MQTPKFLRNLLQSNNYWNKDSAEFTTANEYLGKLYPGQLQKDATGNYTEPEFDMTYEQFLDAQKKFDDDIENAIQEAQDENEENNNIDYSEFVEVAEQIDVLVLMPWGSIENKKLIVYELNMPEEPESESETNQKIWVWHSEDDERICDDCASHDGKIFEDKDAIPEVPVHPNCRCWVEEIELDDNGKPISSKVYKGQKPENKNNTNKVSNMKNVLTKDLKQEILKFEGLKLNFYLDSKGILTIGIGQNVSNFNDFKNLNILDKRTGNPLTTNQKSDLYSQIIQDISNHTFHERNYYNLEISKNDIYTQFDKMLEKSYEELEKKIESFNSFPTSVKQALVDMQFNMGNKKFSDDTWPKLFTAINNRDWKTAAQEASQRKDVQKSRREWTYKMFNSAK
nr:hypothetical protein [Candidatus Enterousia merdequi]